MTKQYLGDSVYVEPGSFLGEIELTTNNGYYDDPRNRIVLGPSEFDALNRWYRQWIEEATGQKEETQP